MTSMTRENKEAKKLFSTNVLVIISLFSALSYVLMLLESPAYLGFLRIELSDIPAIIGGIQFGPLAGVFIELIKNLVKVITATKTAGVGELANFIVSIAYVIPVSILYHSIKGKKKYALTFGSGIIAMTVAGYVVNYFITVPLYATLYGGIDNIISIAQATIPGIKDLNTLVLLGITPFNIVKGLLISIVGYYCYKLLRNRL